MLQALKTQWLGRAGIGLAVRTRCTCLALTHIWAFRILCLAVQLASDLRLRVMTTFQARKRCWVVWPVLKISSGVWDQRNEGGSDEGTATNPTRVLNVDRHR